jgi:hypothetical protein
VDETRFWEMQIKKGCLFFVINVKDLRIPTVIVEGPQLVFFPERYNVVKVIQKGLEEIIC